MTTTEATRIEMTDEDIDDLAWDMAHDKVSAVGANTDKQVDAIFSKLGHVAGMIARRMKAERNAAQRGN